MRTTFYRQLSNKYLHKHLLLFSCILICITIVTISCDKNSTGNNPDEENEEQIGFEIPSYGLFLSVGGDPNGLYYINHLTAQTVKVGNGNTGVEENVAGLTHTGAGKPMIGSNGFTLHKIALDGSSVTVIGDPPGLAFTEGLAFDGQQNILYASSNGFLHIRSPESGETVETVLRPPNQPDIEGLAFDPETRTLYGIARGSQTHQQARRGLFVLDVNKPQGEWEWQELGDTGGLWTGAGLAFDTDGRMLYAVGRMNDLGGLYRIDPETGNSDRVGDIGLESADSGLAWVPAE